jgi:ABC-type uncharacterized transport system permease subunit
VKDDTQVFSIAAAFWPPFLGLLNEYVGVNEFIASIMLRFG